MTHPARRLLPVLLVVTAAAAGSPAIAGAARAGDERATSHQHEGKHGSAARHGRATGARARGARPWADLTVSELRLDESDSGGERVDVDALVDNDGTKSVRPSFVTVSLVDDEDLDDPAVLATLPVGRIAAGASAKVHATVAIPEDLPDGDLSLEVCADATELRRERDEDNNCTSEPFATELEVVEDDEGDDEDR